MTTPLQYGPYELVDNVDYGNHEQALEWLAEHYAGPLSVATGYVGLEGLDTLARVRQARNTRPGCSLAQYPKIWLARSRRPLPVVLSSRCRRCAVNGTSRRFRLPGEPFLSG